MKSFSYFASWMYVWMQMFVLTIGNLVIFGLFISEGFSLQNPLSDLTRAVVVFLIAGVFNLGILYKMFIDGIRYALDTGIENSEQDTVDESGPGFDPEKVDVDELPGLTRRE